MNQHDTQTYKVIKTRRWYDPEGLNIPDPGKEMFAGSYEECCAYLKETYSGMSHNDRAVVEEYTPGERLSVYYPGAIARNQYTIVSDIKSSTRTNKRKITASFDIEDEIRNSDALYRYTSHLFEVLQDEYSQYPDADIDIYLESAQPTNSPNIYNIELMVEIHGYDYASEADSDSFVIHGTYNIATDELDIFDDEDLI